MVRGNQPLVGIIVSEDGEEVTRYFVEDDEVDAAALDADTRAALAAFGAWSDLDWDEMEAALDRIRHESVPTPPIEL